MSGFPWLLAPKGAFATGYRCLCHSVARTPLTRFGTVICLVFNNMPKACPYKRRSQAAVAASDAGVDVDGR